MPKVISTPRGNVSFPDSMTDLEIQAVLQKEFPKGSVSPSEPFDISELGPAETERAGRRAAVSQAGRNTSDFITENLDVVLGVAGGLGGAVLGAPLGPAGAFLGATTLGALGTGGGSLASDALTGEELDYAEAIKSAAISAGFDVATLGLGKVVKVAAAPIIKRAFNEGKTPEQVLKELSSKFGTEPAETGSRESLIETQRFLSERGATLLPSQIGDETGIPDLMENVGRIGMASSPVITQNARRIDEITTEKLNDLMSRNYVEFDTDPDSIGLAAYTIINEGRKAVNASYGATLDEIVTRVGNRPVPIKPIVSVFEQFVKDNTAEGIKGADLHEQTLLFINETLPRLSSEQGATMPVSSLLRFDRIINKELSQVNDIKVTEKYNPDVARELTLLSNQVKDTIQSLLQGVSPQTASIYQTAKKEKDLIKLQNSLHNLSALESDTWQDEYISITQSNENIKLANEALSLGQLHDALNYAIKSSQTFYSKQASEVVSEVNKKAVNLKKLYIELNTLDKQKDSLNKRIAMIHEQDPKNWNIIEFNMLLVDLINIKNIFAKLASKLNKVINEGGIYVEASEQTTKQLALLDDSINILLSQVVKPVSHGLIKFSVSTSE